MGARTRTRWRRLTRGRGGILLLAALLLAGALHRLVSGLDRPLLWAAAAVLVLGALATAGWWAYRRARRALDRAVAARTDMSEVDRMSGRAFEEHVARLMRAHGYTRVSVVGGGYDGGVDIRAQTPDGRACAVQCKRWRRPVPPNEVRAFLGVLADSHRGYLGIFVASHGFTEAAAREAAGRMVLVGRDELALWTGHERPPRLAAA